MKYIDKELFLPARGFISIQYWNLHTSTNSTVLPGNRGDLIILCWCFTYTYSSPSHSWNIPEWLLVLLHPHSLWALLYNNTNTRPNSGTNTACSWNTFKAEILYNVFLKYSNICIKYHICNNVYSITCRRLFLLTILCALPPSTSDTTLSSSLPTQWRSTAVTYIQVLLLAHHLPPLPYAELAILCITPMMQKEELNKKGSMGVTFLIWSCCCWPSQHRKIATHSSIRRLQKGFWAEEATCR